MRPRILVCVVAVVSTRRIVGAFTSISSISSISSSSTLCPRQKCVSVFGKVDYVPGQELFPEKGSSYVPTGLTAEQYAKIKKEEKDVASKMDLGMWGPRFQQTERPDGDWMVVPGLWTSGFQSNEVTTEKNKKKSFGNTPTQAIPTRREQIMSIVRENGSAYFLSYLIIDALISTLSLLRVGTTLTWRGAALLPAQIFTRRMQHGLVVFMKASVVIVEAVKLLASAGSVPTMKRYLEHANRRWLWSPRRTVITTVLAAMVASIGLGMMGVCVQALTKI